MNRPAVAALATLLLAGSAGIALSQPAAKPAGPPQMPPPVTDPAKVPAGHYVSDPRHGGFILKVQHMGMDRSYFRMDKWQATFDYDPAHLESSHVTATVDANSFSQPDPAVSAQFAKEFLGAPTHPTITYDAKSLKRTGPNTGLLTGDLTLNGVTKPVDLNVTFNGFRPAGGMGPARVGFTATGVVHRSDFNVGAGMPLGVIGDVDLDITAEFTKAG
jgi:polyisoprenoid-binding protein YceI